MPDSLRCFDDPYRLCRRAACRARRSIAHHVRRWRPRQAAPYDDDLIAWGQHFLPHYFRQPPSAMHREIAALLDASSRAPRQAESATPSPIEAGEHGKPEAREKNESEISPAASATPPPDGCRSPLAARPPGTPLKLNLLAPRASAKSTLVTLAYVLREALAGREPYIWIISDTQRQAMAHLENVYAELKDNALLQTAYRRRLPLVRTGHRIALDGVAIEAYGTGQRVRGHRWHEHRPTLIVCDDLQNDNHIRSAAARDRSRSWFRGMLMQAGTQRTRLINLGTALHREALAVELHTAPGWTSRRYQAIGAWPTHMHLWAEWEGLYRGMSDGNRGFAASPVAAHHFFTARRDAMQLGAQLLWPEDEDLYTLMCRRAESGSAAFEREKQCLPLNPEECEWPEDYFTGDLWFSRWPDNLRLKTLALDPSKGTDARRGDYSAFVLLGLAADGTFYVEAQLARRPTPQIVADGVELIKQFQPHAFGVEANQFQSLLAADFAAEFQRHGLHAIQPYLLTNRLAKAVRIRRLGPLLANRRCKFKAGSAGTKLLVEQLREFPLAQHDDAPDALEMALRLAETLLQPAPNDGLGNRLI